MTLFSRRWIIRLYWLGWFLTLLHLMNDGRGDSAGPAYWTMAFPVEIAVSFIWPVYWVFQAFDAYVF